MLEQLIGQFFQSGSGRGLFDQLKQQGLDDTQAHAALTATAEGAMKHAAGTGGIAAQTSGLSAGAESASGISSQVAQFVAQKAGIDPTLAQRVVSLALPKLLELIQGNALPGAPRPSPGGLLGALPKDVFSLKR